MEATVYVGPRPDKPADQVRRESKVDKFAKRFELGPLMTGQMSGSRSVPHADDTYSTN